MTDTTTRECGEVLYGDDGAPIAVCTRQWGTEHSHHDDTAHGAIRRHTARPVTTTDTARHEALRAAAMDSRLLITPRARARSLAALEGHDDELSTAARLVLLDGAAWQGLAGGEWARDLGAWSRAADMLEGYVLEAGTRDTDDTDTMTDTGGTP